MKHAPAFLGWITDWLPSASDVAPRVDTLLRELLAASLAMVVLLSVLTVIILVRYRRGSRVNRAPVGIATWKIETAWSLATLAVFLFFFFKGAAAYAIMERIPPGLPEISVVGRQWMWDVRYADGRREFNALHVLKGSPVRIVLSSEDVIHSFFVPAFRIKQDVVPGKVVSTWFNPTREGTFTLFCAQFCGTAHAEMIGKIIVMGPAEFAAWEKGGRKYAGASVGPAARGGEVYARFGCGACHEDPSGRRAPVLDGLYGSVVTLADGRKVRADESYLYDAILRAPASRMTGYALSMPRYDQVIDPADASDLVAFIASRGKPAPQP